MNRREFLKSATVAALAVASPLSLAETPATLVEQIEASVVPTGPFSTGIPDLDDLLGGGLQPGTLTTFVGGPACGKLNMVKLIAKPYPHIYRGGSGWDVGDPMIGFDYFLISRNGLLEDDVERLDEQARRLSKVDDFFEFAQRRLSFLVNMQRVCERNDAAAIVVVALPRKAGISISHSFLSNALVHVSDEGYVGGSVRQLLAVIKSRLGSLGVVQYDRRVF